MSGLSYAGSGKEKARENQTMNKSDVPILILMAVLAGVPFGSYLLSELIDWVIKKAVTIWSQK